MRNRVGILAVLLMLLTLAGSGSIGASEEYQIKPTPVPTVAATATPKGQPTATVTPTPTLEPTATVPPRPGEPYPEAPPCATHDSATYHALWNSQQGCHYDHEHGRNPFTPEMAAAFPGFDLRALLGGVEIGHTNPSSPMENTHKHGGMKWQAQPAVPQGCDSIIEGGQYAVDAAAIQYHSWGKSDEEFETSIHSTVALLRLCDPANPANKGYIFVTQWQQYGERCVSYQGDTAPYPDNFQPEYDCAFGPYFTAPCFGGLADCPLSYEEARQRDSSSLWTSKNTGSGPRPPGSTVFNLLFRVRDNPQSFDRTDFEHPFTWRWLCSNDGGLTFSPANCRYNNSATQVHEVSGRIPESWDNAVFDTNPAIGRITANGFVTSFGQWNAECAAAGPGCFPIKMVDMPVGFYSAELSAAKVSDDTPQNTPERDVYFCNGIPCTETTVGAVPSGWLGAEN